MTPGWWGIVDERAGGIVASAGEQALAEVIRQALIADARSLEEVNHG